MSLNWPSMSTNLAQSHVGEKQENNEAKIDTFVSRPIHGKKVPKLVQAQNLGSEHYLWVFFYTMDGHAPHKHMIAIYSR